MNEQELKFKYIVTAGAIYGTALLVFIFPLIAFSFGADRSIFEVVAVCFYLLSVLPASLCALKFPRFAGAWLILAGILSAAALISQEMPHVRTESAIYVTLSIMWWLFISVIPILFGLAYTRHYSALCLKRSSGMRG